MEDEESVRQVLCEYLSLEGYSVDDATCAEQMRVKLAEFSPNLVVLDIGLPDSSGFDIAKELAERPELSVIILTGKSDPVDKVVGLEIGADDYVTKPFDLREVLARIRSVLRRASRARNAGGVGAVASAGVSHSIAGFEGWQLDITAEELRDPNGQLVKLTSHEYRLLLCLVSRPHGALTREELQSAISGREWAPYERNIDVLVGKLRRKIESDPKEPRLIKTIRNTGYKFTGSVTMTQQAPDVG